MWNAVVRNAGKNESFHRGIEGHELLSFLDKNYSIKVFEKLNAKLKRKNISKRKYLRSKVDLFEDYSHPKTFPPDMFLRLPLGLPNQAYLILGTKGTGIIMNMIIIQACETTIYLFIICGNMIIIN